MNKMRLRNKKKMIRIKKTSIILLVLIIICYSFIKITSNVSIFYLNYAKGELIKLTTTVINSSVSKETLEELDTSNLYIIHKNSDNEIEMVDYNSNMVNTFLDKVTNEIQDNLLKLENGNLNLNPNLDSSSGVLFTIPFGTIFNNPILNNIGPDIPVRMNLVGSLLTNVNVKISEYGINNAFIEMVVFIEVKEQLLLPLLSEEVVITNEIPISYKLVNGKIPSYYGSNGISKNSSIYSIPLE